jgi:hypothetical protein
MRDDMDHISSTKKQLGEQFQMSGLEPHSYFIGIEVSPSTKGCYLSQSKYIQYLLTRLGLIDTQNLQLMDLHLQLHPTDGVPLEDPPRY